MTVRRLSLVTVVTIPAFLLLLVVLTVVQVDYLRRYGWTVADHRGVPWPSAMATGPGGEAMIVGFGLAALGALCLALVAARSLPRRRATVVLVTAVITHAIGMVLATFPLDVPLDDPSLPMSWVRTWHANLHFVGYLLLGLGLLVGTAAGAALGRAGPEQLGLARWSALAFLGLLAGLAIPSSIAWYVFILAGEGWLVVAALLLRASAPAR